MLSLLLNIPIVGPVLLVVMLFLVLSWSGILGGGDTGAEEIRAAEQARCAQLAQGREPLPAACR